MSKQQKSGKKQENLLSYSPFSHSYFFTALFFSGFTVFFVFLEKTIDRMTLLYIKWQEHGTILPMYISIYQ